MIKRFRAWLKPEKEEKEEYSQLFLGFAKRISPPKPKEPENIKEHRTRDWDVNYARKLRKAGRTYDEIGSELGLTGSAIWQGLNNTKSADLPKKKEKIFPKPNVAHKKLKDVYKILAEDFGIKAAIQYYTNSGYKILNKKLYTKQSLTKAEKSYNNYLSRACVLRTTPMELKVFTGLNTESKSKHNNFIRDFYSGETARKKTDYKFSLPAFTSTSLSKSVAETFTRSFYGPKRKKIIHADNHIISIVVPKGSYGAYVSGVSSNKSNPAHNWTNNEHEKEFLIHKNSKIHVDPVPEVKTTRKNGLKDTTTIYREIIWKATLINDGVNDL